MVLGICRTGKRSEANNMFVYIKHIHLPHQCYMILTYILFTLEFKKYVVLSIGFLTRAT